MACNGCVARDTWPADGGTTIAVVDLVSRLVEALVEETLEGVTISGGEPFEQPEALAALVAGLRAHTAAMGRDVDLLVYSGYGEGRLRRRFPEVLAHIDALIPEPYAEARPAPAAWWGSANQRLVALSDLGRQRYADPPTADRAVMQMAVDDGRLWLIGVPRRGDLERVATRLAEAGVELGGVSWRP